MAYILGFLLFVALGLLVVQSLEIQDLRGNIRSMTARHTECHENVLATLRDRAGGIFAGAHLRDLADEYASPASQARLRQFALDNYEEGADPIPSLWLRSKAQALEDALVEKIAAHLQAGHPDTTHAPTEKEAGLHD